MPPKMEALRDCLRAFDFTGLMIEELGWDRCPGQALEIQAGNDRIKLKPVAEKRGMVVLLHEGADGLPPYPLRRKIEQQVRKAHHEHLIIFCDAKRTQQIWQWVKREPGKPAACREHAYHDGHTGQALAERLQALAFALEEEEQLTISDVTARAGRTLDVERVTKKFYERFKKEHAAFLDFIGGITERADQEWYASVMLNRMMFVYFIQRKGFLDGDRDYLRNRLARMRSEDGKDTFYSFYRYFLLRLFHEGLGGAKRTPELDKLLGKIPYLNGGLFDVHELERPDRYGDTIQIPDEAFERIFDYFDQYQWHLDERPLRADNEINPDVLGYIFEKYINQKQMGAYYTKEDITEYISKSTVIPFLLDAAKAKCKVAFENPGGPTVWNLLADDPDRYIYPPVRHGADLPYPAEIAAGINPPTLHQPVGEGPVQTIELRKGWNRPAPSEYALPTETWREVVSRRTRYEEVKAKLASGEVRDINDLITLNLDIRQFAQDVIENCEGPDLLRAIWHAIEKVTILDPTCGSGAFLFAALGILEPLYEACLDRMEVFLSDESNKAEAATRRFTPAGNPILPHKKFEDFTAVLDRVAAHPNRRYFIFKSIILNNLFGVDIMEEAVEICKLRLFLKLAAQVEPDPSHANLGIEPLPDIDFNIKAGNTLVGFATYDEVLKSAEDDLVREQAVEEVKRKAADLQQAFDAFRDRQVEGDGSVPTEHKLELRKRLTGLQDELNRYLADQYGVSPTKEKAYTKWLKSHQPFHWFVEFYGTMDSGGFDVIIGNPPYVEYRQVRDIYLLPRCHYASEQAENLYAYCMERSCSLLGPSCRFGMIVPAGVLGLDESVTLREVLLARYTHNWCSTYAIRPSKLFDGVDQRLCIYLATQARNSAPGIWSSRYHHWLTDERKALFHLIHYTHSFIHDRLNRIPQVGSGQAVSALLKLEANHKKTVSHYYAHGKHGFLMHYHRSPRYWIRAMDFEQYFRSPTRTRSVHHFRDIYFDDAKCGKFAGGLLNSTLFFFWFVSVGNGRNITGTDVEQIPVGTVDVKLLKEMATIFGRLMKDYDRNSFIRKRKDCEFQEFRTSLSKQILDEIDHVLARHYGFTEEELDFIINYDIKYRMGRDAEGEDGS